LEKYNEDATPTRRKRLIGYLSEKDKNIIVARTLRAIIPFLTNKTKFNFFQLTPSYQLTLQEGLVGKYLYEQTALYVYMFIDQREGGFLEDAWNYVRRHVQGRLRKSSIPDYEQVAQDVVQDAMNLFLKKRNEYAKRPEGFFIDQRIESYFVGLIRSYKLITACFRKNRKTVYFGEEIEEKLLGTDNAHGDSLNESETLSRIVRSCVNDQKEKCRALLLTRYWSAFSQPLSYREIVSEADVALRTIERQMPGCEAALRACIVYKTSMQGLRF
jgi:DNA-directed RNA polymerase specialized sigma24 family protein